MRHGTCTVVLAGLTLLFLLAVPASLAASDDACQLLTPQQVSAAVGIPVGAGAHVTPTFVKTCTWTPSGSTKEVSAVTVSYQDASAFAGTKAMTTSMTAHATDSKGNHAETQSVSGIGDDAFYTSMGTGYTAMLVKKGNVSLKIAIYGSMPADKKLEVEKSLAREALGKV